MRLIFIHGFLERETIFCHIAPALEGEKIFINLWEMLNEKPRSALNVYDFAKEVIEKFEIVESDVLIGHSLGGWIAYHIKSYALCRIILISSFTDIKKIGSPLRNTHIIYGIVGWGLKLLFPFRSLKSIFLLLNYRNAPKDLFSQAFDDITKKENHENVINQLKLIFENADNQNLQPFQVQDLRIHAKRDPIVHAPKEKFYEIPGNHFTIYTQPEKVIVPILNFLKHEGI